MLTRNGVCYDFKLSQYRATVDGTTYVFSSQLHLDKFMSKYRDNRETVNRSLSNRFNVHVDVSALADIVLYKKIETRGFLIVTEDKELWQNKSLKYVGGQVTPLNSNGQ